MNACYCRIEIPTSYFAQAMQVISIGSEATSSMAVDIWASTARRTPLMARWYLARLSLVIAASCNFEPTKADDRANRISASKVFLSPNGIADPVHPEQRFGVPKEADRVALCGKKNRS